MKIWIKGKNISFNATNHPKEIVKIVDGVISIYQQSWVRVYPWDKWIIRYLLKKGLRRYSWGPNGTRTYNFSL